MNNNHADEKLRQNATRTAGLSALFKIRKLVDRIDEQDHNDKKHLLIIFLITIILVIAAVYFFLNSDRGHLHIKTNDSTALHSLTAVI